MQAYKYVDMYVCNCYVRKLYVVCFVLNSGNDVTSKETTTTKA